MKELISVLRQCLQMDFWMKSKAYWRRGYSPTLPTMSAIGYRECIRVVNGELSEEQAKVEIRRATQGFRPQAGELVQGV